jgi:SAM-dependent methyltransferase
MLSANLINYRLKALVQNVISWLPDAVSQKVYYAAQRTFGNLRKTSPMYHFARAREMADFLLERGFPLDGRYLEVGTGRTLNIPIGLWLAGAGEFVTVDLNRYLRKDLVESDLKFVRNNRDTVAQLFSKFAGFEQRFGRLEACSDLAGLLRTIKIDYRSPCDASRMIDLAGTFDYHFSCNVMEHIPPESLRAIVVEARRLLKREGKLLHFVDLSDHFAHSDKRLSPLNFLRFDDKSWNRLAGNRFMYQSRQRASDYRSIITTAGFELVSEVVTTHPETLAGVKKGNLPLAEKFEKYEPEDVAALTYNFIASPLPADAKA